MINQCFHVTNNQKLPYKTEKQHELVPLIVFCKKGTSKSSVLRFLSIRIDVTAKLIYCFYKKVIKHYVLVLSGYAKPLAFYVLFKMSRCNFFMRAQVAFKRVNRSSVSTVIWQRIPITDHRKMEEFMVSNCPCINCLKIILVS